MQKKNNKDFNIIIVGVGGQGLLTVLQILTEAAMLENFEVRTSELHGLSQRGGSVEVHIRFGKEIWSPLIKEGGSDLIIALEAQESLKSLKYSSKKNTIFLVNDFVKSIPSEKLLELKKIEKDLKRFSKKLILIPASKICKEKMGTDVVTGVYLISLACFKKLIPLKPDLISKAIRKVIPKKYLELNEKTFELAKAMKHETTRPL